ncbi:MAG: hypothetical protein HY242_03135 [Afipia sp.]|nr:hypothetical protein [Afipia sp.]
MSSNIEYGERYCAFVDILGFRNLIDGLGKGELSVEEMRGLLTTIHKHDGISSQYWPTDFRTQSISDAVAISANVNREGLIEILRALENLTLRLLDKGYFIRGGLVKGRLFHDENVVFGDALVEAFRIESQVARFPRVMATRAVLLDFQQYVAEDEGGSLEDWIKQSDDGPMFVHTLRSTSQFAYRTKLNNLNLNPTEQKNLDVITNRQNMIQKKFDEAIDNPLHFEKVQWFAEYWNRSVPYGGNDFSTIQGPGLNRMIWQNGEPPDIL